MYGPTAGQGSVAACANVSSAETLKNLARYMDRSGRIVVIDFHPELGPHKNEPALQVTKEQTAAWMAPIGFRPVEEFDLFKDNWFVVLLWIVWLRTNERSISEPDGARAESKSGMME